MKILLLIVLIAFLALAGYAVQNPGFQPLWFPKIRDDLRELVRGVSSATREYQDSTRVYKWQDRDGNWQLTNQPPPPDIQFETEDYPRDLNVIVVPPELRDK